MTEGDEFARIERIARVLGPSSAAEVELAIGDDAAILDPSRLRAGERLVWTIDACVEGVHFRRELLSWEDVGWRATVAAASDLLAMGARPIAALAGWTLPEGFDDEAIESIARGQRAACTALGMALVGGNLASAQELTLSTTALGAVDEPVRRDGARPGDRLVVCGAVGEAALGLAWLMRGREAASASALVTAWRRPPVRVEASRALAAIATAMIDVSDGLAQDVGHLAKASGVRVVIEVARLLSRRSAEFAAVGALLRLPLDHLELAGGEDYALVATVPADATLPAGVDVIGAVHAGEGVDVLAADGRRWEAPPPGWRHR
ncbi:MAG: thiamine-phosphate kinase [Polyangiales bacterium]